MLRKQTIAGGHLDLGRWAIVDQCKFVGVRVTATDGEIAITRSVFERCDLSSLSKQVFDDDCTFINCRGPRRATRPRSGPIEPSKPARTTTSYA